MEVINNLDEESREKLKRKELQVYTTKNKVLQAPSTGPKLPQQKLPPPPMSRLLPNPSLPKTNNIDLNFDLESVLAKINVTMPLKETIKIPSMKNRFERFFKVQNESVDPPIMLHVDHFMVQYDDHPPYFMSLQVNKKLLNNFMLELGEGENMMSLKVMKQLGLKITRPYINVCGFESKVIPTHGVIENVKAHLVRYPEIVILMDIVVMDVPDVWGMILSRKFITTLGGTLQMDISIDIPMDDGTYAHFPNMTMAKAHVEEIDIDLETEEIPEPIKEYLPSGSPDDLPFAKEEYFDAIQILENMFFNICFRFFILIIFS
jgi:hypothetical protein